MSSLCLVLNLVTASTLSFLIIKNKLLFDHFPGKLFGSYPTTNRNRRTRPSLDPADSYPNLSRAPVWPVGDPGLLTGGSPTPRTGSRPSPNPDSSHVSALCPCLVPRCCCPAPSQPRLSRPVDRGCSCRGVSATSRLCPAPVPPCPSLAPS